MAEDSPKKTPPTSAPRLSPPPAQAAPITAGPRHRAEPAPVPAPKPPEIDMSAFEEMFAGPSAPEREQGAVGQSGRPEPRTPAGRPLPGVEWAVQWADGRLTPVHSEDAARFVADRYPGCRVACRIVGPWRSASPGN
jgi:hypothetical protein